jgi:flagellar hook-length control protein FliK
VDSKIGSDIAKLLGTLNAKATDSASKSIGNGGSGASFKQALVASESTQNVIDDGKSLPVSGPIQAASQSLGPAVQQASRDLATRASQSEKHALRDFDLVVVGDETEESAVFSFAQQSGMSAQALAQLFAEQGSSAPAALRDGLVAPSLTGETLYAKLESLGLLERLRADIAAALANTNAAQTQTESQVADLSAQLSQFSAPALARVLKDLEEAELKRFLSSSDTASSNLGSPDLSAKWINQLSIEIEPQLSAAAPAITQNLRALLSDPGDSSEAELSASIASLVAPSIQRLVNDASLQSVAAVPAYAGASERPSEGLVAQLESAILESLKGSASLGTATANEPSSAANWNIQTVAKDLAVTLAREIAPEVPSLATMTTNVQEVGNSVQSNLAERLTPLVQRWLSQPSVQNHITAVVQDGAIQPRALSLAIAPQMTQWLRSQALPESDKTRLFTATGAVQSTASGQYPAGAADLATSEKLMARAPFQSVALSPALYSTQPSTVSETELKLARSAAVAQPLPLQVSVSGASMPAAAGLTQAATATLAQVQPSADAAYAQAMTMTQSTAGPNARQATMDRFAMRGVAVKSNQLAEDAKADGVLKVNNPAKSGVEAATVLRDLVMSRATNTTSPQQSLPTTSAVLTGEGVDPSAKFAIQADAGLARQSLLSGADRMASSDMARPGYPAPGNNPQARELVGRQLSEALGHRLAANIAAGHYRLTLNVHPKELGAIDVVMEMRDGRLDAQISSANPVTRELLGDSLPRLRDALQQNGIQLAQLAIGSDSQQGGQSGRGAQPGSSNEAGAADALIADASENILEDLDLDLDLDTIDFWA